MADDSSRSGAARYATPEVLSWLALTHAPHDEALERAFRAGELHGIPAIQIGPAEGRTLQILLRLAGAKKVVEVGTLAGYSAIWIARALPEDGHLWTIEHEPKHAAIARENLAAAGVEDRVTVVEGDGVEQLANLAPKGPFCAVFVDADKGRYDRYGAWAIEHLRRGGLLLGDNAFFFGKLVDEDDPSAAAMRRFHEGAAAKLESVCMPTPDGLLVGRRLD